jgi:hypothetical protein
VNWTKSEIAVLFLLVLAATVALACGAVYVLAMVASAGWHAVAS